MELECFVKNCTNKEHEGGGLHLRLEYNTGTHGTPPPTQFWICWPCFETIATGREKHSQLHRNVLAYEALQQT